MIARISEGCGEFGRRMTNKIEVFLVVEHLNQLAKTRGLNKCDSSLRKMIPTGAAVATKEGRVYTVS